MSLQELQESLDEVVEAYENGEKTADRFEECLKELVFLLESSIDGFFPFFFVVDTPSGTFSLKFPPHSFGKEHIEEARKLAIKTLIATGASRYGIITNFFRFDDAEGAFVFLNDRDHGQRLMFHQQNDAWEDSDPRLLKREIRAPIPFMDILPPLDVPESVVTECKDWLDTIRERPGREIEVLDFEPVQEREV